MVRGLKEKDDKKHAQKAVANDGLISDELVIIGAVKPPRTPQEL